MNIINKRAKRKTNQRLSQAEPSPPQVITQFVPQHIPQPINLTPNPIYFNGMQNQNQISLTKKQFQPNILMPNENEVNTSN